ncbi:MAG: hypothetical protein E6K60_10710 [Nitrospirae bacterium]|nr:MAG: hypothetical protein E6K60_10710 [Nitrospirota bacterium]
MGLRWRDQGIETQTLAIQPAICPVCHKGLYRGITFLTGGWGRCVTCNEVVHYGCLSGGKFRKGRPRVCKNCKAGRVREHQRMPVPPPAAVSAPAVSVSVAPSASPPKSEATSATSAT